MKLEGAGLRFLVYKCGRHSLSHLLGSDLSSTKSLRCQLPRISSQFLRIALLLRIHRFRLLDRCRMPLRPRSDRCPKRHRTGDGSRLEPDVWFHHLTILYRLIHIKMASVCAMVIERALSATKRPGQMRQPYPKMKLRGSGSAG
jgi:hypothetical protein